MLLYPRFIIVPFSEKNGVNEIPNFIIERLLQA